MTAKVVRTIIDVAIKLQSVAISFIVSFILYSYKMPYHSSAKTQSDDERLKEHAKQHKGGMRSKHMKNMKKFMSEGDTFEKAHRKAMKEDGKQKVELDGETFEIKTGALRKQLKVPDDYKFKRSELLKLGKIPTGEVFDFLGKKFKMSKLLKDRIVLGANLMKRK